MLQYCTPSHVWGHVTSSANGKMYTIKINKDSLMRLLKRGERRTDNGAVQILKTIRFILFR